MGNKDLCMRKKIFLQKEKEKENMWPDYVTPHKNFAKIKWELIMIYREQKERQRQGLARTISKKTIRRYIYISAIEIK